MLAGIILENNYRSMFHCAPVALILVTHILTTIITKDVQSLEESKFLVGVHPNRRTHYELTNGQNFKCLDGSRNIPSSFVNDDYCDCLDASDEPGTSACPHGQFFCYNEGYIQKLIPSAWVGDGQCDCCDGSDERFNSNATCSNTCGVLGEIYRQEQERHREIADKGSSIRSQYKKDAKQMREQSTQLLEQYKRELTEKESAIRTLENELNSDFGPSQIYRPLKGKCFNYKDREYTYTLCMFERATQESATGMHTELGRWSGWAGPSDNLYSKQRYDGGMQCWNGPARSAVIEISCGIEDKIVSVTEPAKCEYVYEFISPGACPDLDPPEESPSTEAIVDQAIEQQHNDEEQALTESSLEDHPSIETEEENLSGHEEL